MRRITGLSIHQCRGAAVRLRRRLPWPVQVRTTAQARLFPPSRRLVCDRPACQRGVRHEKLHGTGVSIATDVA